MTKETENAMWMAFMLGAMKGFTWMDNFKPDEVYSLAAPVEILYDTINQTTTEPHKAVV